MISFIQFQPTHESFHFFVRTIGAKDGHLTFSAVTVTVGQFLTLALTNTSWVFTGHEKIMVCCHKRHWSSDGVSLCETHNDSKLLLLLPDAKCHIPYIQFLHYCYHTQNAMSLIVISCLQSSRTSTNPKAAGRGRVAKGPGGRRSAPRR